MIRSATLLVLTLLPIATHCWAQESNPDREIRQLFAEFAKKSRRGGQDSPLVLFDFQQMLERMVGKVDQFQKPQLENFRQSLRSQTDSLLRIEWQHHYLGTVHYSEDRRQAAVLVGVFTDSDYSDHHRYLFQLGKTETAGWRIIDIHRWNLGLDLSQANRLAFVTGSLNWDAMQRRISLLRLVDSQDNYQENWDVMWQCWGHDLSIHFEPARWLMYDLAADNDVFYVRTAEAFQGKLPVLDLRYAMSFDMLDKPELAIKHALKFLAHFGDDYDALGLVFGLYQQLEKPEEAKSIARRRLALAPRCISSLRSLLLVIGNDHTEQFFTHVSDDATLLRVLSSLETEEFEQCPKLVLESILERIKNNDLVLKNNEDLHAKILLGLGHHDQAAKMAKQHRDKNADGPGEHQVWENIYLTALSRGNLMLEEYQNAEDPDAFIAAVSVWSEESLSPINEAVIDAHLEANAEQMADLCFQFSLTYYYNEDYELADKYLSKILGKPDSVDEEMLEQAHEIQCLVWCLTERAGKAVAELEPLDKTFEVVAEFMYEPNDMEFEKVLEIREKLAPDDPVLAIWKAQLSNDQENYQSVIDELTAIKTNDKRLRDEDLRNRLYSLLTYAHIRTKNINKAMFFSRRIVDEHDQRIAQGLIFALQGDIGKFNAVVRDPNFDTEYIIDLLSQDPDFPAEFAGVRKDTRWQANDGMVIPLQNPLQLTNQTLRSAITQSFAKELKQITRDEVTESDVDFLCELGPSSWLVSIGSDRVLIDYRDNPILDSIQDYLADDDQLVQSLDQQKANLMLRAITWDDHHPEDWMLPTRTLNLLRKIADALIVEDCACAMYLDYREVVRDWRPPATRKK